MQTVSLEICKTDVLLFYGKYREHISYGIMLLVIAPVLLNTTHTLITMMRETGGCHRMSMVPDVSAARLEDGLGVLWPHKNPLSGESCLIHF